MHNNNLARLIEIKFDKDTLDRQQKRNYLKIVRNDEKLFTVLKIIDCRDDRQKQKDDVYNYYLNSLSKEEKYQKIDEVPPIYSTDPFPIGPLPQVQQWAFEITSPLDSLGAGSASAAQLDQTALVKQAFITSKVWLTALHSKWEYQTSPAGWKNLHSGEFWPLEQIRNAWRKIQLETDLTLWVLSQINWHQVLIIAGLLACVSIALVLASGTAFTVLVSTGLAASFLVILTLHLQLGSDFTQHLAV